MAWELHGPYLFTALLKVSYQLITSQGIWLSYENFESLGTSVTDKNMPYKDSSASQMKVKTY